MPWKTLSDVLDYLKEHEMLYADTHNQDHSIFRNPDGSYSLYKDNDGYRRGDSLDFPAEQGEQAVLTFLAFVTHTD